jgi:hypothetical protein
MAKAKPHPDQFGFLFDPPQPARDPAALAGLEQRICRAVATILNSDPRCREVVAAEMSVLLEDEVSRAMLDAYASPARDGHKVIMSRFLALVAVCGRHDVLDALLREIGAAVLVGAEVHTARIGHIDRQMARLREERKTLERQAPLIRGGKQT